MKNSAWLFLISLFLLACSTETKQTVDQDLPMYLDHTQPMDDRVSDLIGRMTLEEKIKQMMYDAPAIDRLKVPSYNWWNEALHGVARAGRATVFPQAIGLGATFDRDLAHEIATAISDEARVKFHAMVANNNTERRYTGLTFWTPNVNIFRDPRWGRGMETYGEDPFLMSTLGTAFVEGLQGDDPKYLKSAACAKHYVVHSGPEELRHEFNAIASKKDMEETYFPAFKALVEAGVEGVMCAYNRTNDDACCGSDTLLVQVLRQNWGFDNYIVSDCWALKDFHTEHGVTENAVQTAALAARSTVNLNCGDLYDPHLLQAVEQGLVDEKLIDELLHTLFKTRFKLGFFDPEEEVPFTNIPDSVVGSKKHRRLAREAAQKSMVLLKNRDNTLPLAKDIEYIYVTGPNASSTETLMGNYYGTSPDMVTPLEGLSEKVSLGTTLQYKQGVLMSRPNVNPIDWTTGEMGEADAVIAVMGINGLLEGEEGEAIASATKGDRINMDMPPHQIEFLKKIRKDSDVPIILVINAGSPMIMSELHEIADAIIYAWYPGQEGGRALADLIFGDVSPSGRLPITFPTGLDQLPPYEDYSMKGRTYRYMTESPMYPFGFGLGYAKVSYQSIELDQPVIEQNQNVRVKVKVKNEGSMETDEVVQLYIKDVESSFVIPLMTLKGFKRISLNPGEEKTVEFQIASSMLQVVKPDGSRVLERGDFEIIAAGSAPVDRSIELGASPPVSTRLKLE